MSVVHSYDRPGAPIRRRPVIDAIRVALRSFFAPWRNDSRAVDYHFVIMAIRNLDAAKMAKEDEFYTQLPDIERELQHY